ncbi:phosphatidate phosphatase PAH1 [Nymphaea colorata]|nr:phosphatidate phosphatase PAH1 [Nymphaea colorata]XP_031485274.1 phosphatidate phosphatase PAH1 [Nymphaea colorata]
MNVVGRVGSLISQGVTTVASPFHPFGGAVDIIVVQREGGTYRTTPWCVRFGKFQGVLKVSEKIVTISVNGVDANFHMYLDNSGEAYFLKEVDTREDGCQQDEDLEQSVEKGSSETGIIDVADDACEEKSQTVSGGVIELQMARQEVNNDESSLPVEGFIDEQALDENKEELLSTSSSFRYESAIGVQLDDDGSRMSESSDSEVVLMTVDGHLISAPVSSSENTDYVQLSTPQFYLVPEEDSGMDVNEVEESPENMENMQLNTPQSYLVTEQESGMEINEVEGSTEYQGVYIENCAEKSPERPTLELCEQSPCSVQEFTTSSDSLLEGVIVNNGTGSSSAAEICAAINELTSHIEIKCNGGDCPEFCAENIQDGPDGSVAKLVVDSSQDQEDLFSSCLGLSELTKHIENDDSENLPVELETTHFSFIDEKIDHAHNDDLDKDKTAEVRPENEAPNSDIVEIEQAPTTVAVKNSQSAQDNAGDEATGNMDISEPHLKISPELAKYGLTRSIEISLCGNLLHANMGIAAAAQAFEAHQISEGEFKASGASIIKNKNLIVRCKEKYLPWEKAAALILGMVAFGLEFPSDPLDAIPVEQDVISRLNSRGTSPLPSRGWRFWSIPFRRVKTLEQSNSDSFNDEVSLLSEPPSESPSVTTAAPSNNKTDSPRKQLMRTNIPTSEQIASLNLKDGQNVITFSFCTKVLGKQQVDARIYLWKSNARIVISDVDGTITKSDVLGQFMPLVGRDWTQSGVARLFSAIKENGYQLLFLSARAIAQAYLTRNFLHNLKQDGKALPNGPVLISPDGLSYSFIREVVRRKPHEFKIACLEEIRALFPSDYNPFYAGFGNRDTDELSYRKIGIPKGKIFIINPKGEVAIDNCVDSRSYCSLHTLVNDMFPPTSLTEQEDFNNWNYWKLPFTSIEV